MDQLIHFAVYYAAINIISAIIMMYDKIAAKKSRRRVRERNLMLCACLGGALSMGIVMQIIRHKTRHKKFTVGIPLIFAIQAAAVIFGVWWINR